MNNTEKSRCLRELILAKATLVMPDAFDPISARIIESLGFKAVQCSGFSMAVAAVRPAEADLGMEANLNMSRAIVNAVKVPVMADGEDGFGGPETITATICAYVEAGLAGVNLEDQVLGQPGPKRIVACDVMVEKLTNARKAAKKSNNSELVINGRTDALAVVSDRQAGLKEAVQRANAYLAAGADLAFVTAVATMEEVRFLMSKIQGPITIAAGLPYNIRTLSVKALKDAGVARVSLPAIAIFSAIRAMTDNLRSIRDREDFVDILDKSKICEMEDIAALLKRA
ncbi:MAG: isocitrate lyase/PEP mutase family protein [Kiritimatiellae bacterium]|nr:isocitrate lyase/PEP mutase family protein [Kiritimatiellia bacterium]MDD5520195.1 isocitrate lyase/PEP mutase family protein [Kiritimatiellia bacterium]